MTAPAETKSEFVDSPRGAAPTRRTLMHMIITGAAASTFVPSAVAALEVDPIFAAIEAHKRAYDARSAEIVKTEAYEAAIPAERRKTWRIDEGVFDTDNPDWLAHVRTMDELRDHESEAECALASIVPTTTAGVCALLKYAAEVEARGISWPDLIDPDDESTHRRGRSWYYFVHHNIVESLEQMAA